MKYMALYVRIHITAAVLRNDFEEEELTGEELESRMRGTGRRLQRLLRGLDLTAAAGLGGSDFQIMDPETATRRLQDAAEAHKDALAAAALPEGVPPSWASGGAVIADGGRAASSGMMPSHWDPMANDTPFSMHEVRVHAWVRVQIIRMRAIIV